MWGAGGGGQLPLPGISTRTKVTEIQPSQTQFVIINITAHISNVET